MRFATTLMSLLASAAYVAAGTVTFWTLDDVQRTIVFTPNVPGTPGFDMAPVEVSSAEKTKITFPDGWIGNFYAVPKGGNLKVAGMLGEVNFAGYAGATYFDVSAIVNMTDVNNVKQMWPLNSKTPMSGCEVFPCNNCYVKWDDVQTKSTDEEDLITTLGTGFAY
ncbi:hypothetical protein G7046_g5153 [Stylonectria norvegica]|nr:hypothetical protein G7046_g5153 [Stylonectria norvegica]